MSFPASIACRVGIRPTLPEVATTTNSADRDELRLEFPDLFGKERDILTRSQSNYLETVPLVAYYVQGISSYRASCS